MSKTLEKEMNKTDETLEYFKKLAEQPTSQEEINKFYEKLERRDVIEKIQDYIEHHEADLRAHAKEVRRKIAVAEEDIKKIENERYKGMRTYLDGEIL